MTTEIKKVLENLNRLHTESSATEKIGLLEHMLEDDYFRIVVEMALDETKHYNIKTLPKKKSPRPADFWDIISYLDTLASKQGAKKAEKQLLADMCADDVTLDIVTRILNKDLRCGVAAKTVNAVIPELIKIMPYMRCSSSVKKDNITYPAIAQRKEDGQYVNIFPFADDVEYLSRNGNEFLFPESTLSREILEKFPNKDFVYMGEFRVLNNEGTGYLPRKISNGIVNKALKKNQTMSILESVNVHFICWDMVPTNDFWKGYCKRAYSARWDDLCSAFDFDSERIHLVETKEVANFDEAFDFAIEQLNDGEEGAVLKDYSEVWRDATSTKQIKLKAGDLGKGKQRECELRVVGWYTGKKGTKYEYSIGGLCCESEDRKLVVNVGSGLNDDDRKYQGYNEDGSLNHLPIDVLEQYVNEMFVGNVVTVRFAEIIKDKRGNKPRLFLPRFIEIRNDKTVADTLDQIEEICRCSN